MDNKLKQLLDAAAIVRDETIANENSALRVGKLLVSIIEAYQAAIAAASTANDGYMTAQMVAMLKQHNDTINAIVRFLPMPFDELLTVDPNLISDVAISGDDADAVIFDSNSKTFLLKRHNLYYRTVDNNIEIGRNVTTGRIYVCGSRLFVGMPNRNLSEITDNRVIGLQDL